MLRIARITRLALLVSCAMLFLNGRLVPGQPAFKKYFDRKYFADDSEMKKAYKVSNCAFCHYAASNGRKHFTQYGRALSTLLTKEDANRLTFRSRLERPEVYQRAEQRVLEALEAVEMERSDPTDEESPTFGELLKRGTLPLSRPPTAE